jgi:hypothetical protein
MSELDPILEVFLLIKNNWSLTNDLSISSLSWSTGFFDANIEMPQIVVSQLGGDPTPPMSMGASNAYYLDSDIINIGIWVRPNQDSNTNLGWAKNAVFKMRREVERIVRSGSSLGQDSNGYNRFAYLGQWKKEPMLTTKPILLHSAVTLKIEKTVKGA